MAVQWLEARDSDKLLRGHKLLAGTTVCFQVLVNVRGE